MTISSKISDFLIQIKNAQKVNKTLCILPKSKIVLGTLNILYNEGFINGYALNNKNITVFLKYKLNAEPAIQQINILTKPGVPKYISVRKLQFLKRNNKNLGILILSTSQGILSQKEALLSNNGGHLLCQIL